MIDADSGPDQCSSWLGYVGGSTPTSLMVKTGGVDDGNGRMEKVSMREKKGNREKKKREERERVMGFLGFLGFLTRIYTLFDFSERNFIFAYFKSHFRYLTNMILNQASEPIF